MSSEPDLTVSNNDNYEIPETEDSKPVQQKIEDAIPDCIMANTGSYSMSLSQSETENNLPSLLNGLDEDSQDKLVAPAPPPTVTPTPCESECSNVTVTLNHPVIDDANIKFIMHPNLVGESTGSSRLSCLANETAQESLRVDYKDIFHGRKKPLESNATQAKGTGVTDSGERFVIKTAKEVMYDIATGKWNRRHMVIDEENEGTKKVTSKPCSNANCVRAAERERRHRESVMFQDFKGSTPIFDDGNLPSYHSLLHIWKRQEEDKNKHVWSKDVFKNGFPENETEFIKVWRECRKNPQAYGIIITNPEKIPDFAKECHIGSRVRHVVKPYNKAVLLGQHVEKRPPVRLAGREYYNPDWKPVKNLREREKKKKHYEKMRSLYPHLPVLRDVDYRMNPLTVQHRMKQAEEWHNLVTAASKPRAVVPVSHYAAKLNENSTKGDNERLTTAESTELELGGDKSRYASATAARSKKKSRLRKY